MKITKKHNDGLIQFYGLNMGDLFLDNNKIYIRSTFMTDDDGDSINAVCLNTGEAYFFHDIDLVKKVEAELIVEV